MGYKIIQVDEEGNEVALIGTASVDMGAVGAAIEVLQNKADEMLKPYMQDGALESEDKAVMIAQTIGTVLNLGMNSLSLGKDVAIKELQRQFTEQTLAFRIESVKTDKETKEQRLLTEQLKNGTTTFKNIFYKSYYNKDGNIVQTALFEDDDTSITVGNDTFILFKDFKRLKERVLVDGGGISTVELQHNKLIEDTSYIKVQKDELIKSVIANNKKIGAELIKDMIESISMGSMVAPAAGYTAVLNVANSLTNGLTGTSFSKTEIAKVN